MKKFFKFMLSATSLLSLTGCSLSTVETKSEGEILAGYFTSTSYMDLDKLVSTENGSYGIDLTSSIAEGLKVGISSLISMDPSDLLNWTASNIIDLIFGGEEDQSQKILDSLNQVDSKIDEINKKMDEILVMLDNVLEKQELSSLKDDINTLRNANAYLQTYIDYTKNLNIGKSSKTQLDAATTKAEYTALNNRFKDAPTQINNYAHLLFDPGAKSGKSIFSNITRIISLNHFLFDYQEVQMKCFNDSAYLAPYIYACAIAYGQLNFIMKTNDPSSVEYIDAAAMFETTKKNAERVSKVVEANDIKMRKEGYISFLYPNSDKFIPFYSRIRNINGDTYINHNVDTKKLKDKSYWTDWAFAKEEIHDDDSKPVELYAAKIETTNVIADCISTLVKTKKMDDVLITDLLEDAGFIIPQYVGYKPEEGLHFFAADDLKVYSSYEDTFYQTVQTITGNKTGNLSEGKKAVNWGIGNIDKNHISMYGFQYQIGVLLTPEAAYGYPSSVTVDSSGNIR